MATLWLYERINSNSIWKSTQKSIPFSLIKHMMRVLQTRLFFRTVFWVWLTLHSKEERYLVLHTDKPALEKPTPWLVTKKHQAYMFWQQIRCFTWLITHRKDSPLSSLISKYIVESFLTCWMHEPKSSQEKIKKVTFNSWVSQR